MGGGRRAALLRPFSAVEVRVGGARVRVLVRDAVHALEVVGVAVDHLIRLLVAEVVDLDLLV